MNNREKFRAQAEELVEKMTVEEAASQLLHHAPAIERLGVPEYNWWNEALHGVGRAGIATVFPQAIGMAAAFDPDFLKEEAQIIAEEARAKYNAAQADGDNDIYKGLTFWSPNINIFRDPRWGRGHETYGEDPTLTKKLGNAFIEGLQGDGEYLKLAACAKHFAVHSGPEKLRHAFDAKASEKDLWETYLPAFEAAVKEADVESVMGAYNRTNGEPCCGSKRLLSDILRGEWGFEGHVVSDCWAVKDFHENHHYTKRGEESASLAVRMGCDLNCGCTYEKLLGGLAEGLITEEEIRRAAVRLFTTRFALGMFDPNCEYNRIPYTAVNQPDYKKAAKKAAEESMVLLKNNGILPLKKEKIQNLAVIGPNAYAQAALYGNYHGDSDEYVTNLDGIRRECGEDIRIFYSQGSHLFRTSDDPLCRPNRLFSETVAAVNCSDAVVLCVGLDETLEGEEGDQGNAYASGDKENLFLPESQQLLVEKVLTLGKPVILVINSGSALDLSAYEEKADAIIQAWYSGERGGEALAEILFGRVNPSGKLPVTFYYNNQPIPEFTNYHMAGRTYKFVEAAPWYPFGFGLSYSRFTYANFTVMEQESILRLSVDVTNTSGMDGDEIVEFYARYEGEAFEKPHHKLIGFVRVHVPAAGNSADAGTVCAVCEILLKELESVQEDGSSVLLDGSYTLFAGTCQPDERSIALTQSVPLALHVEAAGGKLKCAAQDGAAEMPVQSVSECEPYIYPDQTDYKAEIQKRQRYGITTPLSELYANPEAWRILTDAVPMMFGPENPHADMMKGLNMGIKDLIDMSGGILSSDVLVGLEEKFKELN